MTPENIAELREDVLHREPAAESAEPAAGSGRTAHSGMAELIVSGSLFGIGEHIVRLGRLLELLLGLLIPRILVRVILDSRLSVSFLYLIRVGVLRHAQALRSNLSFLP